MGLIETIPRLDHLWIENVAVAPGQQGRGYGRLPLAHVEVRAAEFGLYEIRLMTNAAFAANLAFYARLRLRGRRRRAFPRRDGGHDDEAGRRLGPRARRG